MVSELNLKKKLSGSGGWGVNLNLVYVLLIKGVHLCVIGLKIIIYC